MTRIHVPIQHRLLLKNDMARVALVSTSNCMRISFVLMQQVVVPKHFLALFALDKRHVCHFVSPECKKFCSRKVTIVAFVNLGMNVLSIDVNFMGKFIVE